MGKRLRRLFALPPIAAAGGLLLLWSQGITGLASPPATGTGNANAGDVWVDNVGQPAGPGHEMDPHLSCADINLWGAKMADSSGTFSIDSWPPSGNMATAYGPAQWTYDQKVGGTQVIAVIPIASLMAGSQANGDVAQAQQGLHFKLQFSQDPQKHKTFWVRCAAPSPSPSGSPSPSPSGSPSPSPSGSPSPSPSGSPSPSPSGSPSPSPSGSPSPSPSGSTSPSASGSPSPSPSGSVSASATTSPSEPNASVLANTGGGPLDGPAGSLPVMTLIVLMIGGLLVVGGRLLRR